MLKCTIEYELHNCDSYFYRLLGEKNMKKYFVVLMSVLCMLGICACGGSVGNVKTHTVDSKVYTDADIASAIDVIKKEFKKEWNGCTLNEIYYAGDDFSKDYQEWIDRYNANEVIVLLSSFDVDSSGGDGSLNPNSTYEDWMWILVRTGDNKWIHVDHGY